MEVKPIAKVCSPLWPIRNLLNFYSRMGILPMKKLELGKEIPSLSK